MRGSRERRCDFCGKMRPRQGGRDMGERTDGVVGVAGGVLHRYWVCRFCVKRGPFERIKIKLGVV